MRVLLDTHVLLWAMTAPERLGPGGTSISSAEVRLISAVSSWELAIKQGLGKVSVGADIGSFVRRCLQDLAASPLDITLQHAAGVERLPRVHRDPFDRLLVSQAQAEGVVLLTADHALEAYGEAVQLIS